MKPNYYAVIPAEVRYNEKLTANSKLLFGEITALCNKKGVCWATNNYFAELYKVDKKTVSNWIKQLQEQGFLKTELEYDKKTKQVTQRNITICTTGGSNKNMTRGSQKYDQAGNKNMEVNIYNNNINNIKDNTDTYNKVSDFRKDYILAYDHIIKLFHERNRPKDTRQKIQWLDAIRLCDVKDKVKPQQLWWLCNEVKRDSFWGKHFQSLLKLRKSRDGEMYLNKYIGIFGNEQFEILGSEN